MPATQGSNPTVADSLAVIVPAETTIGRPSPTTLRLVNASVSDNTRRAYAGALGQLDGRQLDDAALAAYLAELHDAGRAAAVGSLRDERQARGHGAPESQPGARVESLPIMAVFRKDALAQIVPEVTAISRPTATARRLVDASVSANTRRAGAQRRTAQPLTRLACGGYPGAVPKPAADTWDSSPSWRRRAALATPPIRLPATHIPGFSLLRPGGPSSLLAQLHFPDEQRHLQEPGKPGCFAEDPVEL